MMRRQAPNTWVSQHRSDTLSQDPGALAGKVLRTFARLALLYAWLHILLRIYFLYAVIGWPYP